MDTSQSSLLKMALQAKNRQTALSILEKTTSLPRKEARDCAVLTFHWAPDLLERILDLATPQRPFFWLRYDHLLNPESQLTLQIRGSLLMIAAALNDCTSLELLLRQGAPADYNLQRDYRGIVADLLADGVTVGAFYSPGYSLQTVSLSRPFPDDTDNALLTDADPLSAAIFCNAKECALRLLQEPTVTVTPAVRRALAMLPMNPTQQLIAEQLGTSLEELLLPEDFGSKPNHPLLPAVLRRHPDISPEIMKQWVEHCELEYDSPSRPLYREILSLLDPLALGNMVWALAEKRRPEPLLELTEGLTLLVDRCKVSRGFYPVPLWKYLDHFQFVGEPPEDGLSGLAAALLRLMTPHMFDHQPLSAEELLRLPGVMAILKTEHPDAIFEFLDNTPNFPAQQTLPLKSLLDLHKEVCYDL